VYASEPARSIKNNQKNCEIERWKTAAGTLAAAQSALPLMQLNNENVLNPKLGLKRLQP
jgi:hypothetical protein